MSYKVEYKTHPTSSLDERGHLLQRERRLQRRLPQKVDAS